MTSEIPYLPFDAVRRQHESLARILALLNNSGVETAMRQMQRQQAELRSVIDGSLAAQFTELSKTTRQLYDLSLRSSFPPNLLEQAHVSWLSDLHRASIPTIQLEGVVRMALSDISYDLSVTERFFSTFDYDFLGIHHTVQMSTMAEVQRSMSDLWATYAGLATSMPSIEDIVQLPSFVLPGATRELTTTSHALDVLCPVEGRSERESIEIEPCPLLAEEDADSNLLALLGRVDPHLAKMYRGAVISLGGSNPDRSRHVLTSLRELWNHLFRKLAPNKEVKQWIDNHRIQGVLKDEQPTRLARIRYVLRDLEDGSLRNFVVADEKAMVQLYALYDRLHGLDTGVTDKELNAITVRTESYLSYILMMREWLIE